MKADWTPTGGGGAVTLADDSVKVAMTLEPPFGLEDSLQEEELAFGTVVFQAMRGNSRGQCAFTAAKSHATRATAVAYLLTQQSYRGAPGSLVITEAATTITMTAQLVSAMAVEFKGLRWTIRYVFRITTMS
jgi:hypothetical protein